MMLTLCSTKMTSEHLLSVNLTTHEYVFVLPTAKNLFCENKSLQLAWEWVSDAVLKKPMYSHVASQLPKVILCYSKWMKLKIIFF